MQTNRGYELCQMKDAKMMIAALRPTVANSGKAYPKFSTGVQQKREDLGLTGESRTNR